jgi:hypothetical protein
VQLSRFETDPRVQDVVKGASVKIEIDSAICGEALCGGIDSEEFLKRYQHTREAQREVANSVCVLFLQNSPAETMDASLSKRSKLPASTDVVEDRPYAIEAAKTAGLLLVALRQGGVANLQEVVSRICSCDPEKAGRVS